MSLLQIIQNVLLASIFCVPACGSGFENYSLGPPEVLYREIHSHSIVAIEEDKWLEGHVLFASTYYVATTDGKSTHLLAGNYSQQGYVEGISTAARFNGIRDITQTNEKTIIVSDLNNCCLRSLSRLSGQTILFAGAPGACATQDGAAIGAARFNRNSGLLIQGNSMYVLESTGNALRKLDMSTMVVNTVVSASTQLVGAQYLLPLDGFNLLATWQRGVSRISLLTSTVTPLTTSERRCFDGSLKNSYFDRPWGMELIDEGVILLADFYNNNLQLINMEMSKVSTICIGPPQICTMPSPGSLLKLNDTLYIGSANTLQKHKILKTDINECASSQHSCHPSADCFNTIGSYTCSCRKGFVGDGRSRCEDINECEGDNVSCSQDSFCFNTIGSHLCFCKPGFTGDGQNCTDIDECSADDQRCGENARCINTRGAYRCSCRTGYSDRINNICTDVDECLTGENACHHQADCMNTPGSYQCHCKDGLFGNGTYCEEVHAHDCPANVTAILQERDHTQITLMYPPTSVHTLLLPAGSHQHQVVYGSKVCITEIKVIPFAQLQRRLVLTADYDGVQCDQLSRFSFTMVQSTANHKFSFLKPYCNCSLSGSASVTCSGSTLKVTWNTDQTYQTSNITEILPKLNKTPITLDAHLLELTIMGKTVMFVQPKRNDRNEVVTRLLVPICPDGFQPTADYKDCQ